MTPSHSSAITPPQSLIDHFKSKGLSDKQAVAFAKNAARTQRNAAARRAAKKR